MWNKFRVFSKFKFSLQDPWMMAVTTAKRKFSPSNFDSPTFRWNISNILAPLSYFCHFLQTFTTCLWSFSDALNSLKSQSVNILNIQPVLQSSLTFFKAEVYVKKVNNLRISVIMKSALSSVKTSNAHNIFTFYILSFWEHNFSI